VVIERVRGTDLTVPLVKLRTAGVVVEEGADTLRIKAGDLEAIDLVTLPYPGVPHRSAAAADGAAHPGARDLPLHRERLRVAVLVRRCS
jgi:hypothetical protein